MMWLDTLAEALVNMAGHGFDPQGCKLPAFKPRQENRAKLPEQPRKVADLADDDLLTDEEMLDWRHYGYGKKAIERIAKSKTETRKSNAVVVDFDELPADMHGITEREYGEMLAYTPQLKDLVLASKVKRLKKTKGLAEIAGMLGEKEQLIRHYSSALGKAKP